MSRDAMGARGRLQSWWWDLPLRWKGFIVVGLPSLALIPAIVAAALLNTDQDRLRREAREDQAIQDVALQVRIDVVDLESDVLAMVATDDPTLVGDVETRRAQIDAALRSLVEGADGLTVGDEAAAAAEASDQLLAVLDRVVARDGTAASSTERADAVADVVARHGAMVERFDALDERANAVLAATRGSLDDRSVQIIIVSVAGVVLSAIVGYLANWMFMRGIVQRVRHVGHAARRVMFGERVIEIEEPARDEIGLLVADLRRAGELLIANNIELEQSRDDERDRLHQERVIRDVSRRVHAALGQRDVLEATVRELGVATDADRAIIFAIEDLALGDLLAEWCRQGLTEIGVGQRLPADDQRNANLGRLIASGELLAVDDVATDTSLLESTRQVLQSLGVGSLLIAPVTADAQPLAVLVLLAIDRTRPWDAGAERLAGVVAGDVATALSHARLYERELEMVKRLQDLDQAKSNFVASVSHELRTPLTSIRGYVEMLRDGDAGELETEQEQMLDVVQRNADRLLVLIEDLLTLSRIESGSFHVGRAAVELGAIVESTVSELRPQGAGRGVDLVAEVEPGLPAVLGDTAQIERILLNLLSNAIKFSPQGGSVVARLTSDGGDGLTLSVSDSGIGIPEEEQDRLFSRFFRSSTSQSLAIPGTGLGLVIVKSIVDHHGGDIVVCSRPGDGTTITVRLPIAVGEPVAV